MTDAVLFFSWISISLLFILVSESWDVVASLAILEVLWVILILLCGLIGGLLVDALAMYLVIAVISISAVELVLVFLVVLLNYVKR